MVTSQILDNIVHNCIVKKFPDGSLEILAADRAIFRESGWELSDKWDKGRAPRGEHSEARRADNLARAKRRARSAVSDLALSNNFRFFVTLTLSSEKVDRYDVGAVTKKLNAWLDNQVRRRGLAYVLVAERHKDGAVHFHGFFNDVLATVDSGTISINGRPRKPRSARQRAEWLADGGHVVYNLPAWTLGFTTAIELYGERSSAVGYVCKYITKAEEKVGGRWYYSGGELRRPEVSFCDVDFNKFSELEGYRFRVDSIGVEMLKLKVEGGRNCEESF